MSIDKEVPENLLREAVYCVYLVENAEGRRYAGMKGDEEKRQSERKRQSESARRPFSFLGCGDHAYQCRNSKTCTGFTEDVEELIVYQDIEAIL